MIVMDNVANIRGIRVIEDLYTPEFNYKKVKRTLRERLFTRPFNPFNPFERFKEVKDGRCIIRHNYGIVVHPSTAIAIRTQVGS